MKERIVILADKNLGPITSKMGNSAIRFAPDKIVAVIDRSKVGKVVNDVLGFGGNIPIHSSLEETLVYDPNVLLIGISPPGGALPSDWYSWIIEAIQNKLHIVSGLHEYISNIAEFKLLAEKYRVKIKDLRKYEGRDILARGLARNFKSKIVLTVGTHGNCGKMTATILMVKALQEMKRSAEWFATGQIGIFLQKRGVPLDAIKGDFISGILEHHLKKMDGNYEFLFVEGQGSLFHMAYSPVSLGILHGCLPDAMILCHRPDIGTNDYGVDTGNLLKAIEINEAVASIAKPAKITCIALNTYNLSNEAARQIIDDTQKITGLPTTDPVRFGADILVKSLINHFNSQ